MKWNIFKQKEKEVPLEERKGCWEAIEIAGDASFQENGTRRTLATCNVGVKCKVSYLTAVNLALVNAMCKVIKEQKMKNKTISKQENFDSLAKEFEKVYKDYFTGETGHIEQDMLGIYFIPISADSDDLYIQQDRLSRTIEFFTALKNLQIKYQEDVVSESLYQRNELGGKIKHAALKLRETADHKIRVCFGTTLEERFGIVDIGALLGVAHGLYKEVGKRIAEREQIKEELVEKEHYLDFTQDTYFDNDNKETKLPKHHFST